jgi:hypothetical protein
MSQLKFIVTEYVTYLTNLQSTGLKKNEHCVSFIVIFIIPQIYHASNRGIHSSRDLSSEAI